MGASSSYGKTKLFCQQNNKFWVALLAVSAALVLGLAVLLAFQDGKFGANGSKMASGDTAGGYTTSGAAAPYAQPVTPPVPAAQPMTPTAMSLPAGVQVAGVAPNDTAQQLQTAFNQVAEVVRPCVVNINAVRPSAAANRTVAANGLQFVDPFDGVPDKTIGNTAFESVGSGVIIDPRGYVVTNAHLVQGATAIVITRFNDARPLSASMVGIAPDRDLALLHIIEPGPYPAAQLGNSDQVQVGDWVLTVGNPFGLGHTVTSGIVSSRRSSMMIAGVEYKGLLQTDAPINQGSSGGPLVDLRGEVIGINTAIYAPTGVFSGTGFAIPSNQVGSFVARNMPDQPTPIQGAEPAVLAQPMPQLQQAVPMDPMQTIQQQQNQGQAWMGVDGTDVTPQMAAKLGLARQQGMFVQMVVEDGPADDAEIRAGDVITEMAGQPVADRASLQAIVAALPPGLKVPVVTVRRGKTTTRQVKLAMKPKR